MTALKSKDTGLLVAALFFLLIGCVHFARLLSPFSVIMAGNEVPMWASVVATVMGMGLAGWFFYLKKQ